MEKQKYSFMSETKCPNCGKKTYTPYQGQKAFCDKACETNYRGKKRFEKI